MSATPWKDVSAVQTRRPEAPRVAAGAGLPARVMPQTNGNALLLVDGTPMGIYASEARAEAGIEVLARMGLVEGRAS